MKRSIKCMFILYRQNRGVEDIEKEKNTRKLLGAVLFSCRQAPPTRRKKKEKKFAPAQKPKMPALLRTKNSLIKNGARAPCPCTLRARSPAPRPCTKFYFPFCLKYRLETL
eukprot:sb/3477162/